MPDIAGSAHLGAEYLENAVALAMKTSSHQITGQSVGLEVATDRTMI